jgi:hypothetical protein
MLQSAQRAFGWTLKLRRTSMPLVLRMSTKKNWTFDSGCALEIPKLFKDQWRLKDCTPSDNII